MRTVLLKNYGYWLGEVDPMHWFLERGFEQGDIDDLPMQRQSLYNFQRKSKVFFKTLD